MSISAYKELETFAVEMAIDAGKILLEYQHKAKIVTQKTSSLDFATEADLASENYIRGEIGKRFPSHGILGEEQGVTNSESDYIWIVDPLDGTLDYTRGFSSFDVFIALEHKSQLIVGCVYRPTTNNTFSSSKGFGTRKNNTQVNVSDVTSLEESIIYFSLPRHSTPAEEAVRSLRVLQPLVMEAGLVRDAWEGGMVMANVAAGSGEACIFERIGPKWWDVAAGILMVEEAGGRVTDLYGEKISNHDLTRGLVASNGKIHDQLLALTQKGR